MVLIYHDSNNRTGTKKALFLTKYNIDVSSNPFSYSSKGAFFFKILIKWRKKNVRVYEKLTIISPYPKVDLISILIISGFFKIKLIEVLIVFLFFSRHFWCIAFWVDC